MPFSESQTKLLADLFTMTQAWETGGGTGIVVHLAKAPLSPNPGSDPATFTEADYDGYAAQTIAPPLGAAFAKGTDGAQQYLNSIMSWIPSGTTTVNTIYGYWLVSRAGDYIGAEAFAAPQGPLAPTRPLHFAMCLAIGQPVMTAIVLP